MANGNLPTIGKTRFCSRRRLAIDDGHLVAEFLEIVSRGDAEQAGAQNNNAHVENLKFDALEHGDQKLKIDSNRTDVQVAAPPVLDT